MNCKERFVTHSRVFLYMLMGLICPAILFTFFIAFGAESYQYWADRYHTTLTSIYIFSRLPTETWLGPLWRDDILAGNPWIISTATSPLALDSLFGRYLHLSPFGIEMIGNLMLYGIAVISMYLYLRQALQSSLEAATIGAAIFAATLYWDCILNTNPIIPMAAAWMPALLMMAHRVDAMTGRSALLPCIGLSLLFWGCAIHSNPATLPITLFLVGVYAVVVFGFGWTSFRILLALGVGLLLYSPFLWLYAEAGTVSRKAVTVEVSRGVQYWLAQGKVMFSQIALGLNRYGLYLVVVLGIAIWFCIGPRWGEERPKPRRVLLFSVVTSIVIFMIEFFHETINEAKRAIPLLGGWNVLRFADFACFGVATLVTWMFDRTVFRSEDGGLSPNRRKALRWVIVMTGVLGTFQISYAAYRMRAVPSTIFPQNIVLFSYLACYAIATFSLLAILYRRTRRPSFGFPLNGSEVRRLWSTGLIVLSVTFITSVLAYRSGLVMPQGVAVKADVAPIMTYKQRYAVPDEVMAIKGFYGGVGRVLDLTSPLNDETWMVGSESTIFPQSGLRVLSGYTNLYPAWYGLLIHVGINGRSGRPWNIVQVEDTDRTNFQILPLLDVEYILAKHGTVLPGYRPVPQFESTGKTLYQVQDGSRLGPAFISPGVRCFADSEEALKAIHAATLSELRAQAVLVAGDPASAQFCHPQAGPASHVEAVPSLIRSHRGQDHVSLEVENSPGGILTLSDTYYPGWKVLVNGTETPMLRTYTALRGVPIGPGHQSVEFIYRPDLFHLLLKLSSACLIFLLLVAAIVWIREHMTAKTSGQPRKAESLTAARDF